MGIVQYILFKIGCIYYNWRNRNESGSSDTQSLQNSEAGGSTLRIRQEPIIKESWQPKSHSRQMMLPFKPTRFREPYVPKKTTASTKFYLIPGEDSETRRQRLYGMNSSVGTWDSCNSASCNSAAQGGYYTWTRRRVIHPDIYKSTQ